MTAKWRYGDSWEKFPIKEGETWSYRESHIAVADLRYPLPDFMQQADMIYCDPPWNKGNVNSFITKAGMDSYVEDFHIFMDVLFDKIAWINPQVCYLEVGERHRCDFMSRMGNLYPNVKSWEITYYKKNLCYLIRGGISPTADDFSGLDEAHTPEITIGLENPKCVADPCTGQGLTLLAAHKHKVRFAGTELNRRRLAVAIDRAAKTGVKYAPDISE
jgi:hypothetical protein